MNAVLRWITRPWAGVRVARAELEKSQADRPAVRILADDLDRIHREHIAARIHRAMRGDQG